MENEHTSIVFSSEIQSLTEQNSSFDKGILRVCYTGVNRNKSCITKETFERCMSSIYNCPIVCRYDRETDSIGAHDVELVRKNGDFKLVHNTYPVGVIPTGAKYWWDTLEEDNGDVHEYLYVEALLWKRQEAYEKIKENGVTDESMEIDIKRKRLADGILYIEDFEFTAFCLLESKSPCFESASLEVFALDDFKSQLTEMMDDLKVAFELVQTSDEADIDNNFSVKGGNTTLEDEIKTIEELDAVAEEPAAVEEVTDPAEAVFESEAEPVSEPDSDAVEDNAAPTEEFALSSNILNAMYDAITVERVQKDWGETCRYWYVDHDMERHEVYATDLQDWKLYGFTFEMNGDNVIIDWSSKKRMKNDIVDFDEGDQPSFFSSADENISAVFSAAKTSWESEMNALKEENATLRKFKVDTEAAEVFSHFQELDGIEAFDELKKNYEQYSKETLEEKCYAIRGRNSVNVTSAQFSLEQPSARVVVEPIAEEDDEPYGGLFKKYNHRK